jgi:uncharacterized protein YjbJ (UPF0337 family)
MSSSKSDKTKGTLERSKGKAKEAAGKLTHDEGLTREGRKDQVKGDARGAAGDIKNAGKKVKKSVRDAH